MKRFVFKVQAAVLAVFLLTTPLINASAALPDDRFSEAELDELLAPIALYPDPLLAQVVPAATFIDQLKKRIGYWEGALTTMPSPDNSGTLA
jgi:hypothetical protein